MDMYDQPTESQVPRPEDETALEASLPVTNSMPDELTMQATQAASFPTSEPNFPSSLADQPTLRGSLPVTGNMYEEQVMQATQAASFPTSSPNFPSSLADQPTLIQKSVARRKFMGKSLAGLVGIGGAALVGGVALGEWLSHGGAQSLSNLAHGNSPQASNVQIGHLLRKAGFGASASEVSVYSNLGYQGAVDRLLNYQQVDDSAMENRLKALNIDLTKPVDQQRWWLLRMAWTQRPLLEKMTLFWHGVLVSSFHKVGGPKAYQRMIIQNNFLRAHAFDTFDNILLGITADPAMLFYLDLTTSTKTHPNENYARELMELFTVGVANYTQQDVFSGAAALTGWHVRGNSSYYNPANHSNLPVKFMGQTGSFTYKDIVRILANHPAAPTFICRKLFTFFLYENPSNDDLKPLVDAYVQSGHNMGAVMRALLLSPQFSSAQAYRSRLKSPVEFTVGAYRSLGIQGDGMGLPEITTIMGQTLFDPPNVAGWPGDKVSSSWLNSGTWMTRLNYIDMLLARGTVGRSAKTAPLINVQGMVNENKLNSPEQFVDHFATFLLDNPLPDERRTQVLDYFTASGNAGKTSITLTNGQAYPLNRVRGALYLMMASPEYQLN